MVCHSIPCRNKVVPGKDRLLAARPAALLFYSTGSTLHPHRRPCPSDRDWSHCCSISLDRSFGVRRAQERNGLQHAKSTFDFGCWSFDTRIHSDDNLGEIKAK